MRQVQKMERGARRALFAAALAFLHLALPVAAEEPRAASEKTLTVGIVDTFSPEFYVKTYAPTLDHLARMLPEYRFRYVDIDYRNVLESVEREKPDLLVSTASTYVELVDRPGAHQIATRRPAGSASAARTLASTFVVPAASPAKTLADLKGKTVAVADRASFDGWLIAQGEIARQGFDPDRFFSSLYETHYGIPGVAEYVALGAADAGVLSTCEYERLVESGQLREGVLRVIDRRDDPMGSDGGAAPGCVRSTDLYPDAVIATLPWCGAEAQSDLTIAILSMPAAGREFRWVVESDFRPTWSLLKTLRIGPFVHMRDMSLPAIWERSRTEIFLGLAFLLAVIFHIVSINLLVRRRTRQLTVAVKAAQELHEEAQAARQKLAGLERASIVSQLTSIFAHEIKQPIMNLALYAGALRLYLGKRGELSEKASSLLDSVEAEVERSSEIVERVRAYAKKRDARPQALDLRDVVAAAVKTITPAPACLEASGLPTALVWADPFEIQFIVANFIKNALAAVAEVKKPEVRVEIVPEGEAAWRLSVTDNGPALTDEAFARLGKAGASTKADGLGFGLSIAVTIAERNRGHIEFRRRAGGGLEAALVLGRYEKGEES